MFHLESLFHRKELVTASGGRNSAAGDLIESSTESYIRRQCVGSVTIQKKLLRSQTSPSTSTNKKLTKLLLNVNIQRSFGPVHVIISIEETVGDLIKAAIEVYLKEKRWPLLPETDARCFDLHYSQFSLECKFYLIFITPFRFLRSIVFLVAFIYTCVQSIHIGGTGEF